MGSQIIAGPYSATYVGTTGIPAASSTLVIPAPLPGYRAIVTKMIFNIRLANATAPVQTLTFVTDDNNAVSGLPTYTLGCDSTAFANRTYVITYDFGAGPTGGGGLSLSPSMFTNVDTTASSSIKIAVQAAASVGFTSGYVSWYYDKA